MDRTSERPLIDELAGLPKHGTTDSARRRRDNNGRIMMQTILDEDFATMAQSRRNLATGAVPELAFGRNEPAPRHFHQGLHAELDRSHPGAVPAEGAAA